VIPGRVFLTVDFRHPNDNVLTEMDAALRGFCASIRSDSGMMVDLQQIWHSPPIRFDDTCVAAVCAGAERHGYAYREIVSGAGHDACYMSRIAPTSMVFVPCKGGISHAEIEYATPEDLAAGCQVLLEAIVMRANASVATSEQPADDANRRTGDLRKGDI
jgi:N-carbamoyl-L-amino-acid hydrolase